ncbi:MAG: hypothetical protein ACP5J3_00980 [Pyrobaculum sp.]
MRVETLYFSDLFTSARIDKPVIARSEFTHRFMFVESSVAELWSMLYIAELAVTDEHVGDFEVVLSHWPLLFEREYVEVRQRKAKRTLRSELTVSPATHILV